MATPFIDSEGPSVQYYHLQSHTPPPAEKTLLWLQGVNDAGPPLHPSIDSTSEYAEETPGKTVQMLPGDLPPERHPLSPPPPVAPLHASPRKPRREEPPSDWVPPSYLAPRGNEPQPPPSESRIGGLDLEYAVFGDHGAGSEASYQRTLQQAAGGYPPVEGEHDDLDDLEGDLYDDDVDSNEQERPQSMMSPRAESRTVAIEDTNPRSPRYLSQSTGPSFGNINRPGSFAPISIAPKQAESGINIQIQPPTDTAHSREASRVSRSGAQSEATVDPVAEISDELQNLWGPPGSVLPPIKTQGTGTSARWKPPPESAHTETSFFKPAGPAGSVHANAVPLPPSAPMTAQVTGSRVVPQSTGQTSSRIAPQTTGMTGKQSTARGVPAPAPVAPQITGQTSRQSMRGPIAPQTTGKQSTRGPIQPQTTGKQSTRGPIQTQVTGSRTGSGAKVVPQMTGRTSKTGTTRTQVIQPMPRHPGSAVGGTSTVGRAKSPLGKGSVSGSQVTGQYGGGYQSFGGAMDGVPDEQGSYIGEGGYANHNYENDHYPGEDGNSFAGEGMAYTGEELGRAPSVAESNHTARNEHKLHTFGGSVAPSEGGGGIHPLRSVAPSEGGTAAHQFRTASPAGSRVSHVRSTSGTPNGHRHEERVPTPTRSHHHSMSGGYAPENDFRHHQSGDRTPTPSEGGIIDRVPEMSERELLEVLKTPRTTYSVSPSVLAEEVSRSHYHDEDLCILLHAAEDPNQHEVIRKAVRKAAKMRIKRLAVDEERRKEPLPIAAPPPDSSVAPQWAQPLFHMLQDAQTRLDSLEGGRNRIEAPPSRMGGSQRPDSEAHYDLNIGRTPATTHANINRASTVPSGTHVGESVLGSKTNDYQHGLGYDDHHTHEREPSVMGGQSYMGHPREQQEQSMYGNDQSMFGGDHENEPSIAGANGELEEELYKLRMKNPEKSEKQWNNDEAPEIPGENGEEPQSAVSGTNAGALQAYVAPPAWQRVHQRLLNWAMVWPLSELDKALTSTERGHQVEEIALSIWCTQVYKRYVRARMSEGGVNASGDGGTQKVDRMFVPPNMADAISTAVYNGRHGDACQMLKDMWSPFGLDGMPRLIIVLARHRRDEHHWVTHRFSLPDGQLSTYDTYPERSLPDGRPLGWWFAIRNAWPHASYPPADALVQKMVRINRPMQLLVDCSVAAAAIWRNLLMGSKAERSVDLERLRDLINTEVKSLKQRKEMGRLTVSNNKWDE
ncbi:cellulosome anchoring protein, cohesin region [Ceratobasidium sp. AG-Ba]|nr:cellulosome anchoring protein, cohesin region [Ceratobasidium sp. AG-Ba]QRW11343.1 cellulosome anchoring protein, cohesin region [Ceratobasidium sp. AG-Ba]